MTRSKRDLAKATKQELAERSEKSPRKASPPKPARSRRKPAQPDEQAGAVAVLERSDELEELNAGATPPSFDGHANFAIGIVNQPPTPAISGQSLTLATGHGARMPATPFNATVRDPAAIMPTGGGDAEVIRVTNVTGDTLTFTRVQEGSNGRVIAAGDILIAGITKKAITDLEAVLSSLIGGDGTIGSGSRPLAPAVVNAIPDVIVPTATGTQSTDTANLQAALNSVPAGGRFFYKGAYNINAALNVPVPMSIESGGWASNGGPTGPNGPVSMSSIVGSKITQFAAATDIFQIFLSGVTVNLRRLAIGFDSSIAGNTGHGFNATPTATFSGKPDGGLILFTWEDLICIGHDGNHNAYIIENPVGYCEITKITGIGGGGLKLITNTARTNYGNIVFTATYMDVFNAASSATSGGHGYELVAGAGRSAGGGTANINGFGLCVFNRPQCNLTGAAAATGFQAAWTSSTGAAQPDIVKVNDPDLEIQAGSTWVGGGSVPYFTDFGGPGSGTVVEGGLLTHPPLVGFDTTHGYRKLTGSGTWVPPRSLVVGSPIRIRLIGGGGGGGGGGSASAVTNQVGGGGGGAGGVLDFEYIIGSLAGYTYATGAGGASGAGAVANGAAGGNGGDGGTTSFNGTGFQARGGAGGAGGPSNSSAAAQGGAASTPGNRVSTVLLPGAGGVSQSPNGNAAAIMPPGVVGGGAGGGASGTLGGGGGGADTSGRFPANSSQGGGTGANQPGTSGAAGTTATTPGCGGGGGGGGAPTTGTGGAGGVGAAGQIEIWW